MQLVATASPVSNMSDIVWTSPVYGPEEGYEPEDGYDTGVDTDPDSDIEEFEEEESPEEKAHSSDEDFIVDDSLARDYLEDRSYVHTASEDDGDEETQLSYLLESGALNPQSVQRV